MPIATKSSLCYYDNMAEVVINYTPQEYGQSQKRKATKARNATITGTIALIGMCYGIWYALNQIVNN